jgi:hypothetical protein
MIISQSLKIIAFQLSLFKDCPLYNKQKNTQVLGNTRFISCVEHDISDLFTALVRYHVQLSLFINHSKYFNTDN